MKMTKIVLPILSLACIFNLNAQWQSPGPGYKGNPVQDSIMRAMMKNRFGGMRGNCKPRPNYHFEHNSIVQFTSIQPGKDTMYNKTQYFISDSGLFVAYKIIESKKTKVKSGEDGEKPGMNAPKSTTIMALKDSLIYTLMGEGDKKRGMCNSYKKQDLPGFMRNKKDSSEGNFGNMVKTGKTKTICGYVCDEYASESKEIKRSMWVTQDASPWIVSMHRGLATNSQGSSSSAMYRGMMMELTTEHKVKHSISVWKVIELNKMSPTDISTAGYTFN
jgi:hypothetical protein